MDRPWVAASMPPPVAAPNAEPAPTRPATVLAPATTRAPLPDLPPELGPPVSGEFGLRWVDVIGRRTRRDSGLRGSSVAGSVVTLPPAFDLRAGVLKRKEPVGVQALGAELAKSGSAGEERSPGDGGSFVGPVDTGGAMVALCSAFLLVTCRDHPSLRAHMQQQHPPIGQQ
jgi:hypothetical protein